VIDHTNNCRAKAEYCELMSLSKLGLKYQNFRKNVIFWGEFRNVCVVKNEPK